MNTNLKYWFDYSALYSMLDSQRQSRGLSWNRLSAELGIAASTIKNSGGGGPMETDGVRAMVAWLNLAPEYFIRCKDGLSVPPPEAQVLINKGKMRFDRIALFDELNKKRLKLGLTWSNVAAEVGGVAPSTLTNLNKPGRLSVEVMVSATGWLGKSVESFTYYSER